MPHTPWRAEAIGNIKREVDARSDEDIYEISDEAVEAAGTRTEIAGVWTFVCTGGIECNRVFALKQ